MLDQLKQVYRQALNDKIEAIKSHLREVRAGDTEAEARLRIIAHSLHGSGTTYGFPDISKAAKAVEHANKEELLKKLAVLITVLQDTAAETDAPELEATEAPEPEKRILIIEDDQDISSLLALVLGGKFEDYSIDIVETAQEVPDALKQAGYALIILDLVLPDSDGRELLKLIKQSAHKDAPVFILSGMDNARIQEDCLQLGASHFFNKPFDPEKIASEMEAVFNGESTERTPEPAPVINAAAATRKKTGRILLAEDDELLARIIKHRLSREGLNVIHVEDGEKALMKLKKGDFDLVILDVKMPVIDGFEVLENFRSDSRHGDVPVIMLTAMGSERDIVRGYDLGATDYILKPFSPVELIARVKSLIG